MNQRKKVPVQKLVRSRKNTSPVCEGHPYTYVHLPNFHTAPPQFFIFFLFCICVVVVLVESEEERANTGDHQQYYRG